MENTNVEHSTDGNKVYIQLEDVIESVEYAFAQARQIIMHELDASFELDGINTTNTKLDSIQWHTHKLVKAGKNLQYLYLARERDIFTLHENECKYCMGTGISTKFNEDCSMCNGTGESNYWQTHERKG